MESQTAAGAECIDAIVQEYHTFRAGKDLNPASAIFGPNWAVVLHGEEPNGTWAVTLVRQPGAVVRPHCVGTYDVVDAAADELLAGLNAGQGSFEPPVVMVRGLARTFIAVGGARLLGIIDLDENAAVLLGAGKDAFFVVYHDGARTELVASGLPERLRMLTLDAVLDRHAADSPPQQTIAAEVQRDHARIVEGSAQTAAAGRPSPTGAVRNGLRRLAERCKAASAPGAAKKRKPRAKKGRAAPPRKKASGIRGRCGVSILIEALLAIGVLGSGDLVGSTPEVHWAICGYIPDFSLTLRGLADTLRLLLRTASYLVTRPRPNCWRIRLCGLVDPEDPIHRKLCKQTPGKYVMKDEPDPDAARIRAAITRPRVTRGGGSTPGAAGPAAGPGAPATPSGTPDPQAASAGTPMAPGSTIAVPAALPSATSPQAPNAPEAPSSVPDARAGALAAPSSTTPTPSATAGATNASTISSSATDPKASPVSPSVVSAAVSRATGRQAGPSGSSDPRVVPATPSSPAAPAASARTTTAPAAPASPTGLRRPVAGPDAAAPSTLPNPHVGAPTMPSHPTAPAAPAAPARTADTPAVPANAQLARGPVAGPDAAVAPSTLPSPQAHAPAAPSSATDAIPALTNASPLACAPATGRRSERARIARAPWRFGSTFNSLNAHVTRARQGHAADEARAAEPAEPDAPCAAARVADDASVTPLEDAGQAKAKDNARAQAHAEATPEIMSAAPGDAALATTSAAPRGDRSTPTAEVGAAVQACARDPMQVHLASTDELTAPGDVQALPAPVDVPQVTDQTSAPVHVHKPGEDLGDPGEVAARTKARWSSWLEQLRRDVPRAAESSAARPRQKPPARDENGASASPRLRLHEAFERRTGDGPTSDALP